MPLTPRKETLPRRGCGASAGNPPAHRSLPSAAGGSRARLRLGKPPEGDAAPRQDRPRRSGAPFRARPAGTGRELLRTPPTAERRGSAAASFQPHLPGGHRRGRAGCGSGDDRAGSPAGGERRCPLGRAATGPRRLAAPGRSPLRCPRVSRPPLPKHRPARRARARRRSAPRHPRTWEGPRRPPGPAAAVAAATCPSPARDGGAAPRGRYGNSREKGGKN